MKAHSRQFNSANQKLHEKETMKHEWMKLNTQLDKLKNVVVLQLS